MSYSGGDMGTATFFAGSYVGGSEAGICWYTLNSASGEIVDAGNVSGVPYPAFLAQSPDGNWIYAVSETTEAAQATFGVSAGQTGRAGSVWSLRASPNGLVVDDNRMSGGDLPTHLTVHPSGRWLAVSNYGDTNGGASVAMFELGEDGTLGEMTCLARHQGGGPVLERQAAAHVHSTLFSASGHHLVAADLGADALVVYRFDPRSGGLDRRQSCRTPAGWGPRYMAWSPDGMTLFVVGELAGEIGVFAYDESTGSLELIARTSTFDRIDRKDILPSGLRLHPDRPLLYVANRGAVNSVSTFEYATGRGLTLVHDSPTYGLWPRDFALSIDARTMLVANQFSDSIAVLGLNGDGYPSGQLSAIDLPAASFVGSWNLTTESADSGLVAP